MKDVYEDSAVRVVYNITTGQYRVFSKINGDDGHLGSLYGAILAGRLMGRGFDVDTKRHRRRMV